MKRKTKDEFHGMKVSELRKKVEELKKQIKEESLNMLTKEVKNRHGVKELRKKLAVMLSIARDKELAEGK